MKKISLLLVAVIVPILLFAYSSIVRVTYYYTTDDFFKDSSNKYTVDAEIFSTYGNVLKVAKFIDIESKKRFKKVEQPKKAWAIRVRGELYCNLAFYSKSSSQGVYIRPQIIGKYCLAICTTDDVSAFNGTFYGGGLSGALMSDIEKKDSPWLWKGALNEKSPKKNFLLVCNTEKRFKYYKGLQNARWEPLTKHNFNELMGENFTKEQLHEFTPETMIAYFKEKNKS